jgi:multiple sugar transport system permease protein
MTSKQTHPQLQIAPKPRDTSRFPVALYLKHLFLIALCLLMLVPFLWMLRVSLTTSGNVFGAGLKILPDDTRWENYRDAFTIVPFGVFLLNSLKVSAAVIVGQVITCTFAGYAFARLRFPGRELMFYLVLATLMIPVQVTLVPLYLILRNLGFINTHWALILPSLASPFGVFLMRQFFIALPNELEDAAKMDGANVPQFLRFVAFPLARPVIATLAVLAFVSSWGNLIAPLIFIDDLEKATVPLGLLQFSSTYATNWPALMAATAVSLLPSLALYLFAQRYIISAYSMAGVQK